MRRIPRNRFMRQRRKQRRDAQPPEKRCLTCSLPPNTWVPRSSSKSYLTSIPPEIRNQILKHLLINDGPIEADYLTTQGNKYVDQWTRKGWQSGFNPLPGERHPGPTTEENLAVLASTCSQLYYEASSVYYGQNSFRFHDIPGLQIFLESIGTRRRVCIKDITFVYPYARLPFPSATSKLLSECNLKKLSIWVVKDNKPLRNAWRNVFRADGLKSLRRIRGWRDVDVKVVEAMDWNERFLERKSVQDYKDTGRAVFDREHLRDFEEILRKDFKKEKAVGEEVGRETRSRMGKKDEKKEDVDKGKGKGKGKEVEWKEWKYVSRRTRQVAEREERGCECLYQVDTEEQPGREL